MTSALPVQTCLWFDGDAEAAAALYTALIPGSAITRVTRMAPEALPRLLGAPDRAAAGRAMQAMLQMGKIDIAALEAAFQGD